MNKEQEDLKTFKAPVVEVKIEKTYTISVADRSLGTFTEAGEMCGMKQLTGPNGTIVIDTPVGFEDILSHIFNSSSESFRTGIIKASPLIIESMKKIINEHKASLKKPKEDKGVTGPGPCPTGEIGPVEAPENDKKEEKE